MPWSLLICWILHGTGVFWLCYQLVPGPSLSYSFFSSSLFLFLLILQPVSSLFFFFLPAVFIFYSLWDSFTTHLCNNNEWPVKVLWAGTATKEHANNFSKNCVVDLSHTCLGPLEWTSGIPCPLESRQNCACWD